MLSRARVVEGLGTHLRSATRVTCISLELADAASSAATLVVQNIDIVFLKRWLPCPVPLRGSLGRRATETLSASRERAGASDARPMVCVHRAHKAI